MQVMELYAKYMKISEEFIIFLSIEKEGKWSLLFIGNSEIKAATSTKINCFVHTVYTIYCGFSSSAEL